MRMRLHKSTANGSYEIYPIYELDYTYISNLTGFGIDESSDTLTNKNYKARKYHCTNANLRNGIDASIPLLETSDGNIIPFWHRFRTQMMIGSHNSWVLDQENRESYAAIQQGIQPDDWGINPNYITLFQDYFTMDGNSSTYFYFPRTVFVDEAYSSSKSYYEDTKRTELRMFYTDTGTSFSAWKMSISRGAQNTLFARQYGFAKYPAYPSSGSGTKAHYNLTSDDNTIFGNDFGYKYELGITSQYHTSAYYQSGASFHDGANCPMVFVHFTANGTDFYGVALIQLSSFTGEKETCFPDAIVVTALDKTFWGSSIIPGGGGGGGNWGPASYAGGANGQWTFSSDNRGDTTGATVEGIASDRRTALQAFYSQSHGYQLHQILPALIPDIFGLLYSSSFLDRYTQSIFNPLSAVISLHLLPQRLCDPQAATSALTLSGYDVSANLPTPQNFPIIATIHHEHIGTYDFEATDTYLDYAPFTTAYLHLPYVGVLEIDINAIAGGSISVDYLTDAQTGNCAAYITCVDRDGNSEIKYCATGNCAYTLPMFAINQDGAAVGKIVGSTLGLGMAAITGNPAAAVTAATGLAGGIFDAATAKRNTQITGSFGGNPGMISDTACWLEIIRPCIVQPANFDPLHGTPSLLSGTIAAYNDYGDGYQGFLRVLDIDADGIHATADEIQQIETILKTGIYVNTQ